MNKELLKNLQLQAGGSHYPDINPEMQAKFAELIVRECAAIAESRPIWVVVGKMIKEHFGVEE